MIGRWFRHGGPGDWALIHALLVLHAYRLVVQLLYHGLGDSTQHFLFLLFWVAMVIGAWMASRRTATGWVRGAGRVTVTLLAALLVLPNIDAASSVAGAVALRWVAWGTVAACAGLVLLLHAERWSRLRHVLWLVAPLFVLSEPMLAAALARPVAWPPVAPGQAQTAKTGQPSTTLVLLLDELNARDAQVLVKTLERQGLTVNTQPLLPVDDSTLRVVPAMFTHQRFDRARACSPSAVCSGTTVLDFARVRATRPDIDTVGFYHPYCSIAGLRSCRRIREPLSFYRPDRLGCVTWRRLHIPGAFTIDGCEKTYNNAWNQMVQATLDAIDAAPVWKLGGMLFAHIPLPHPPALAGGGTLASQYNQNLGRVALLLGGYVSRARARGGALNVVIFSDHPLRPSMWCGQWNFATRGCKDTARFADEHVPLIVASERAVDLSGFHTNDQVFDVLTLLPQ